MGDRTAMKEWGQFALKYGPAWALLLLFVYFTLVDIKQSQADSQRQHDDLKYAIGQMQDITGQSHMAQERILYVLRRSCVNTAQTSTDRDACLRDRD
jgi:hypothetical protein